MVSTAMDPECIRDIITNTVTSLTSAVTAAVRSQDLPCSSRGRDNSGEEEPCKKKKRPSCPLPSRFLRKDKGKQKKVAVKTWSKDIVCLPADYHSRSQELPIPRGNSRAQLAKAGLIGKVLLSSDMSESDMRAEICSVFNVSFHEEKTFPFKFLQTIGGGSRCLTVPCTSPTFQWTAKELVSSAGKGAVYILAEKQTNTPDIVEDDCEESKEGSSWRYVSTYIANYS